MLTLNLKLSSFMGSEKIKKSVSKTALFRIINLFKWMISIDVRERAYYIFEFHRDSQSIEWYKYRRGQNSTNVLRIYESHSRINDNDSVSQSFIGFIICVMPHVYTYIGQNMRKCPIRQNFDIQRKQCKWYEYLL